MAGLAGPLVHSDNNHDVYYNIIGILIITGKSQCIIINAHA